MRVAQYLVTVFIVLSLNFFLPRMMPGDPLDVLTGDPSADMPILLTEEMRAKLLAHYGLDKPLLEQCADYFGDLLQGDLGWSIYYNVSVVSLIWGRLRWTLLLMGVATILYVSLGVYLGAQSGWHRGSALDVGLLVGVLATGSWPAFFLAMLLVVFFSVRWGWFPLGGAMTLGFREAGGLARALDVAHHLVLPCAALVLTQTPSVYLLMRNAMLGVLGEDYIRTAASKGQCQRAILWRHAVPNALLPIVTMIAMRFGFLIMGAISVEVVFSYPGMGTLLVDAFAVRDYPVLQGAFLCVMLTILTLNFLADLLYARIDPRVRCA